MLAVNGGGSSWAKGGESESECLCQLGDHPSPTSPGFYQLEVGKGQASGREWVLSPLEQHTGTYRGERVVLFRCQLRDPKACSISKVLVGNRD